jgi:hypothetical protein
MTTALQNLYPRGPRQTNFTDTLTGPSAAGSLAFTPFPGVDVAEVLLEFTVLSRTGGAEAVGDVYVEKTMVAFNTVGGVVSVVPQTQGVIFVAATPTMTGAIFGSSGVGALAELNYTTPPQLNSATVVGVKANITEVGV